jgi:hypothetical protein
MNTIYCIHIFMINIVLLFNFHVHLFANLTENQETIGLRLLSVKERLFR